MYFRKQKMLLEVYFIMYSLHKGRKTKILRQILVHVGSFGLHLRIIVLIKQKIVNKLLNDIGKLLHYMRA